MVATTSNKNHTVQWSSNSSGWGNSSNTITIHNSTNSGTISSSTPNTPSRRSDKCNHRTADGGRCGLDPCFEDDRCHWHTSEQCFRSTDDGSPCELPGSQADGACHIHTRGCNESLTHKGVEKAVFHSVKGAYRWLGLHSDMRRGNMPIQPRRAARIAAEAGMAYLVCEDYKYDRDKSLEDIRDKYVDDKGKIDKLISWFKSGFESPEDFDPNEGPLDDDGLKKAIKRAWNKIDKGKHKAGARVAVAAGEAYLGEKLEVK